MRGLWFPDLFSFGHCRAREQESKRAREQESKRAREQTGTGIVVPRARSALHGRSRLEHSEHQRAVGPRVGDVDREGPRGRVTVAIGRSEGGFAQAVLRRGIPQCLVLFCF
jgi:hypothetical protein